MKTAKLHILYIEQKKFFTKEINNKVYNNTMNPKKVLKQNGYYISEFWEQ